MDMTNYAGAESNYLKASDIKGATPTVNIVKSEIVNIPRVIYHADNRNAVANFGRIVKVWHDMSKDALQLLALLLSPSAVPSEGPRLAQRNDTDHGLEWGC